MHQPLDGSDFLKEIARILRSQFSLEDSSLESEAPLALRGFSFYLNWIKWFSSVQHKFSHAS